MAHEDSVTQADSKQFKNERKEYELPAGFTWDEQKKKYCQGDLWTVLETYGYSDWMGYHRSAEKGGHDRRHYRLLRHPKRNRFGYVFCHRGLYDRARGIPENSLLAVQNGLQNGFFLHELDGNLSIRPESRKVNRSIFITHDEIAIRVTSKPRRWSSLKLSEIMRTRLVGRDFDEVKGTYATSYLNTTQKVPFMSDLGPIWRDEVDEAVPGGSTKYIQFDMRGKDFADMLAHLYNYAQDDRSDHLLLKGYNTQFSTYDELKIATENSELGKAPGDPLYDVGRQRTFFAIIVFYPDSIIDLALKHKKTYLWKPDRYSLSYEEIRNAFRTQLASFHKVDGIRFIFEIVFTGLGLGYNVQDGTARNPLDGTPLKDREVIFQSRVDRAMIDIGLELKETNEMAILSSCTRLCDVRTPQGKEIIWNMKTGEPMITPDGEQGLAKRLRAVHGGLYPQSDLVVADDPYAEVAARTWIDEHAGLDRSKLLHMTYNEWIEEGERKAVGLVAAVKKLNGPFLPNQFEGSPDDGLKILIDKKPHDSGYQIWAHNWWWASLVGMAGVVAWALHTPQS